MLKVHTSNYRIEGFTKEVSPRELAALARERNVPLVNDLGSGTLVDLARFGLAHEPTVAEAIADGADLVTFSGDKLLGGPQAGFIVGRKDADRDDQQEPDEARAAPRQDADRSARGDAASSTAIPTAWRERLPTMRLLARPEAGHRGAGAAARAADRVQRSATHSRSSTIDCASQIGSGALPLETVPSAGLAIRPRRARTKAAR